MKKTYLTPNSSVILVPDAVCGPGETFSYEIKDTDGTSIKYGQTEEGVPEGDIDAKRNNFDFWED